MSDNTDIQSLEPNPSVEHIKALTKGDTEDLCDATDAAIEEGGGFGWVKLPARDILQSYWHGVLTMPVRELIAARLDGVIFGTCQLWKPPVNNQAQAHIVQLTTHFVAPWARGHGLGRMMLDKAEEIAAAQGFGVINLDVRETAEHAIKLYESHGYKRCGEHPDYARVDGKTLRGFYYYKTLKPQEPKEQ